MDGPDVRHRLFDEKRGVEYIVLAYRELAQNEVVQAIRFYLAHAKRKPKRGMRVEIVTLIGARD